MNEQTEVSRPPRMVEIDVIIDAPPGAPRPEIYMKEICTNILHQEYKNPDYTFMGEWGWTFKVISKEFEQLQAEAMKYLTGVYNTHQIRYAQFTKKGTKP